MKIVDAIVRALVIALLCAMFYVAGEHNGRRDAFKDMMAALREVYAADTLVADTTRGK